MSKDFLLTNRLVSLVKTFRSRLFILIVILLIFSSFIMVSVETVQYDHKNEVEKLSLMATDYILSDDVLDPLPSIQISMILTSPHSAVEVNASMYFGFSELMYGYGIGVGFRQKYLEVNGDFVLSPIIGLGWGEMREYSFLYIAGELRFDHWIEGLPGWSSRRHYPVWTQTTTFGGLFSGVFDPENTSRVDKAGTILEYENLTIYFEDGSSFICGPRIITVGVNFTQEDEVWTSTPIFDTSDNEGITTENTSISILLRGDIPINLPLVSVIIIVPLSIILVSFLYRRYNRKHV